MQHPRLHQWQAHIACAATYDSCCLLEYGYKGHITNRPNANTSNGPLGSNIRGPSNTTITQPNSMPMATQDKMYYLFVPVFTPLLPDDSHEEHTGKGLPQPPTPRRTKSSLRQDQREERARTTRAFARNKTNEPRIMGESIATHGQDETNRSLLARRFARPPPELAVPSVKQNILA